MEFSRNLKIVTIIGVPLSHKGRLFNLAAVLQHGKLHGFVPKTYLPNYKEFYEQRWFSSGADIREGETLKFCGQNVPISPRLVFSFSDMKFGIELCEDLWAPNPPSTALSLSGAEVIFNLSASNELVGKSGYLEDLIRIHSAQCISGYVYSGAGWGESSQDLVYGGRIYVQKTGACSSVASAS